MMEEHAKPRRSGRTARKAQRALGPGADRSRVGRGSIGGQFKPLIDRDLERIHAASLDLLEQVGMADPTDAWRDRVLAAGGGMGDDGRLRFPRAMVEDAVVKAGRNFTLRGRDPRHDMEMTGTRTYLGAGSASVNRMDFASGNFRETCLRDVYDATRLADAMENIHFIKRPGIARDLDGALALDVNSAYAGMSGTSKHFITSFFEPDHLDQTVEMFDLSLGGDGSGGRFRDRPFASAICTFVVPPMRFAADNCNVLDAAARAGMPAWAAAAGQAGATSPASLSGALTQGNAEVLAGITAMNLEWPGHPLMYGNWPLVVDLRTGAFAGGGGESALLTAASAQLAQFYDIPSVLLAGASSAKEPDAQFGWEKGCLFSAALWSGGNMAYVCAGTLADLLADSLEAWVIDAQMSGNALRVLEGIDTSDDMIGVEVIRDVVTGEGHYLGHDHTIGLMEQEYVYPEITDRSTIEGWKEGGRIVTRDRARRIVERVLSGHYPAHVGDGDDARIRAAFDIALPREAMKPGGWAR